MQILKTFLFVALSMSLQVTVAQNNCTPGDPKTSAAFAEFMKSNLAKNWNTAKFGPLSGANSGEFKDCTSGSGTLGFSKGLGSVGGRALALGYANRNGRMEAAVFEVTETGPRSYSALAYDVQGNAIFSINVRDGHVTDAQSLGQSGCAGVYLTGFAETVLGTATLGPAGFAFGMGMMMFSLWDNGCL
jgi:hypothetical protein